MSKFSFTFGLKTLLLLIRSRRNCGHGEALGRDPCQVAQVRPATLYPVGQAAGFDRHVQVDQEAAQGRGI